MAYLVYDHQADTSKGDKLFLFVDGKPLAFATSASLDIKGDTIDSSNKMSGNWKESIVGQLGWSISSDSLFSKKAGHMSFDTLFAKMVAREPIEIKFGEVTDGTLTIATGHKGKAIITALSKKGDVGAICSSSITLTGVGALETLTTT